MQKIKFISIILSFLLIGNYSFAETFKYDVEVDAKIGDNFRGIEWGTDISTLKGMHSKGKTLEGIYTYSKEGDDLKIDGLTLKNIEYGFWEGKFCSVQLIVKEESNWVALKQLTFEKYGEGIEVIKDATQEQYVWQGQMAYIFLMYDRSSNEGWITITKMTKMTE